MTFADAIRSLQRHWRVSVAIMVLTVAGLGIFLFTRNEVRAPDRWKQDVQLLVPVRDKDGNIPAGVPPNLLQGQTQVALSQETTGAALKAAGLSENDRGDYGFGFTQASPNADGSGPRGDIQTLSITGPDRTQATDLANAFADAYISARGDQVAAGNKGETDSAKKGLQALENRLVEVRAELAKSNPTLVGLVDAANAGSTNSNSNSRNNDDTPGFTIPEGTPIDQALLVYEGRELVARAKATSTDYAQQAANALVPQTYATVVERPYPTQITPPLPSPLVPVAVVLGLGFLLAIAVPILMDRLDHSIRTARTASNALAAPVLSTIPPPSSSDLVTIAQPGSDRDSAYRTLAATSVATDQLPRAIVVTSPVGEMQDTVAANFAAALAGLGLRVALVATDPRQAWFDGAVERVNVPSLPDLLELACAGRLNGQVRDSLVPTDVQNLAILTPGSIHADALLDGLPTVLQALADADVDVTVIAGPALLEEPAATILAWSTRSVLWVVEAGEVTEQEAREAASRLELAGATPFGVALVDAKD